MQQTARQLSRAPIQVGLLWKFGEGGWLVLALPVHEWWCFYEVVAGCTPHPAATAHLSTGLLMWGISIRLRLLVQGQKNDFTLLPFHNTCPPLIFHPSPLSDVSVFLGNAWCKSMNISRIFDVISYYICLTFLVVFSSLGKRVSVSCAHTQASLCGDYFSCLTQIAYGVPALCGYAQHLVVNDMTACMLVWWDYPWRGLAHVVSCLLKLYEPGDAWGACNTCYDSGYMLSRGVYLVSCHLPLHSAFFVGFKSADYFVYAEVQLFKCGTIGSLF